MSPGIVTVAYIGATILFILALGGLSGAVKSIASMVARKVSTA